MLVFQNLRTLDFEGIETVVRINGLDTPYGREDIRAMVKARPDIIRLPKTDCAQDVQEVEKLIEIEERKNDMPVGTIGMMAAIESPLGVINAYSIATSSERLIGIAIGAEDYVTAMKTARSASGSRSSMHAVPSSLQHVLQGSVPSIRSTRTSTTKRASKLRCG